MEENNQQTSIPLLCSKGCGYYGSPNFDGLCSKCHRSMESQAEKEQDKIIPASELKKSENLKSESPTEPTEKENQDEARADIKPETSDSEKDTSPKVEESCKDTTSESSSAAPPSSKKPNRCAFCKKRVGLTGITCHCGGLFCAAHRYSDSHDCKFDYRETGQDEIRKANPQILCSKVNKI